MKRRSLIYVLVAAMMVSLFAVTPGALAAKKPALNKKSATLKVGDKLKLKVKNNKKKVKWSSSKKKVAAVSKKGVVTAKSAGKAKITAKIGKKKLVCKVTVTAKKDSNNGGKDPGTTPADTGIKIANLVFPNPYQVLISLSGAQALTAANFTIKTKDYEAGAYIRVLNILNVTTSDSINYTIDLNNDSRMYNNSFVQITVTGLKGTGTEVKEAAYSRGKQTRETWATMSFTKDEMSIDLTYFETLYGNSVVNSVTGLPQGMKYSTNNEGGLRIYGTPTKAGAFTAVATATDELGNVEKRSIYILISSDDEIAALIRPKTVIVSADGNITYTLNETYLYVEGGSGSYVYSIIGEDHGLSIDSSGDISGTINKPGTYQIEIEITDDNNSSITTTCTEVITVKQGRTVKGKIKDVQGNAVSDDVHVMFENADPSAEYDEGYAYPDANGDYSMLVVDGTYTAYASKDYATSPAKTVTVKSDMTGVDLTLPIYKITLVDDSNNLPEYVSWLDDNTGKTYESYKNELYLPEGTFNLSMRREIGLLTYESKISNFVVNASSPKSVNIVVTVKNSLESRLRGTIGLERIDVVSGKTDTYFYYKFVSPVSDTLYFYSVTDSADPIGHLLDEYGNVLASDDDSESDSNFGFTYDCEKGKTYYFGFSAFRDNESFQIGVSELL